jgi:PPIC-type peptidyl-prolyl cis-trans isomerase-like protein
MARSVVTTESDQTSTRVVSARPPRPHAPLERVLGAIAPCFRVERARYWWAAICLVAPSLSSLGACTQHAADGEGPSLARAASSAGFEAAAKGPVPSVPHASVAVAERAGVPSERWAPYPPGRWRLLPPKALAPVVIWVAHILVRHAEAVDEESFSFANWKSVAAPVSRTRAEALARAQEIAEQARQHPERFAELARLQSEDITNRGQGGSLGGLRASQLFFWPQVLDAFAAIRPGEVSDPVETRFGFHVFLRQAPPAEETVSGRHIVISHDRAMWSRMATCKDELPSRTREEALDLATQLFHAVQTDPESFADAVQRYSDDCDVAVGGDLGSWSTRDVAPFERRLDVLHGLAMGETAPPRETHVGFEIIVRTPERLRQRFAAQLISIPFDPWAADSDPSARGGALRKIREVARELEEHPDRFEELQRSNCCTEPYVWEEGREPPSLRSVLSALKPREISMKPVRVSGAYVLARKLDPNRVASPPRSIAELELPSAEHVTLESLLGLLSFDAAREALPRLSRESAGALGLSPAVTGELGALVDGWARSSEALVPERREAPLEALLERSRALLADDVYASYRAALEQGLAASALSRRMPMF